MKWAKRIAVVVVVLLIGAAVFVFGIMPGRVGSDMNEVRLPPPYTVSPEAAALHKALFVADLHADSLLWSRHLARKGTWGHVDIPRLRAGNMAIQAFTAVTKSPKDQNIHENAADAPDKITQLVMAQRWPLRTWGSLRERALYQAARLQRLVDHDDEFVLLRTQGDVKQFVADREANPQRLGAYLGIEGLHCLEGDLENLGALFDAGCCAWILTKCIVGRLRPRRNRLGTNIARRVLTHQFRDANFVNVQGRAEEHTAASCHPHPDAHTRYATPSR